KAFRSDDLVDDALRLRCATFLVELLNIDLFNYRAMHKQADNFEGHVYRGMCISPADLAWFARITQGPIGQRYLAIPLAMTSASREREIALAMALEKSRRTPGQQPVLWDIEISGLDSELLAIYHEAFPASVVTSLCAVPIDGISDYQDEKEVLL